MAETSGPSVDQANAERELGIAAFSRRDWAAAIGHLEASRALDPFSTQTLFNLGATLYIADRAEEAIAVFLHALRIEPGNAEVHNDLGVALQSLNRATEALEHFRKAIALKPGLADAYSNVGNLLMELGMIDAAHAACLSSIALAPSRGIFYFNLANVRRFVAADALVAKMEGLTATPSAQSDEDLIALHFALGKAYDDFGAVERSMAHWLTGNALKRRKIEYDEQATLGQLERIRRAFGRESIQDSDSARDGSRVPVFIVGMPRSGTTMVEQMLASHPRVHGGGELYVLDRLVTGLGDRFPESIAGMTEADLRDLRRRYLDDTEIRRGDVSHVTDKMPWNFRYIGLIRRILPGARIVHVRRDPYATCMSCFSKLFNKHQEFSYDLAELGRYYRAYRALMVHWSAILPDDAMLEVRYEALVADFEAQARRIVAYCGLEWNEACLSFHRNGRLVRTASAVQVRRPVYTASIDRWRSYRSLAGPLLETLGPDLASESFEAGDRGKVALPK